MSGCGGEVRWNAAETLLRVQFIAGRGKVVRMGTTAVCMVAELVLEGATE